ncbi:hypothetical protein L6164_026701 [Bauhinia variegata]|uniref:Uncharacterized protein n=1 Tax=Bauhinia variegata TaxID=167791 RepID=A0ACB9LR93_BAUVA|nr:hypothetical protein L6164_026701 [Bauhinia variegata]
MEYDNGYDHYHGEAQQIQMSQDSITNLQFSAAPVVNNLQQYDASVPPYPQATGVPVSYPAATTNQQLSAPPAANHLHHYQQCDAAAAAPYPASTTNQQPHVVVVNQVSAPPATTQPPPRILVPWSTHLCDCFSDMSICCLTFWCPCVTFGLIAEKADNGSKPCLLSAICYVSVAFLIGCPNFYSFPYRTKLRRQYSLQASPCEDCMVHCFCEPCALCQEYLEIQNQLGGNVQQQRGVVAVGTTAPSVERGMKR